MERPFRAIALMLAACFLFSLSDAISKKLGETLPAVEIGFFRYLVFVAMALGMSWHAGTKPWPVQDPARQVLRGLTLVGSGLFFIVALRHLPLADAAAVGFISPLLITALSVPMLGEKVGIRRWAAVAVGLVGVLLVVRPGTGAFKPEAIWVLASSSTWAVASVLSRQMAGRDNPTTTILWSAVVGLILLTVLLPFQWHAPTAHDLLLCLALGIFASTGQILMLQSYRFAGASTLAPFIYVQLAWSTSLGWLIWGTLPDHWTWAGTAVIVASGIYTVHRERVRARERTVAA